VLLDEPTAGLDVDAWHALWDAVRSYQVQGGTVILTSHYLEEVEALAERIIVVDRGRVRADGSLADVRSMVAARRACFRAADPRGLDGVERARWDGDRHELWTGVADQLVRDLVTSGADFADLEVADASLEEAFLTLTAGDGARDTMRSHTGADSGKVDQ